MEESEKYAGGLLRQQHQQHQQQRRLYSLNSLLLHRSLGIDVVSRRRTRPTFWSNRIRDLYQEEWSLDTSTKILTGACGNNRRRGGGVTTTSCMDFCNQDRFLLSGNSQGIVSIHDISPWGQQQQRKQQQQISQQSQSHSQAQFTPRIYEPIQQARVVSSNHGGDAGTTGTLVSTQWYPVDSGAFVTATAQGSVQIWDTAEMIPVCHVQPFLYDNNNNNNHHYTSYSHLRSGMVAGTAAMLSCMELGPSLLLAATGSVQSNLIKLIDLGTNASSHSLHHASITNGISSVAWSPNNSNILASSSGGGGGTIQLWDIRKPGSLACLTTLNEQDGSYPSDLTVSKAYCTDGSHWRTIKLLEEKHRKQQQQQQQQQLRSLHSKTRAIKNKKTKSSTFLKGTAPNNYNTTNNNNTTTTTSQSAPTTTAVSSSNPNQQPSKITFDATGHTIIHARNGNIQLWDLRSAGHVIPRRFIAPDQTGKVCNTKTSVTLVITEKSNNNSNNNNILWTTKGCHAYAYDIQKGGTPKHVLQGHLGSIRSLVVQESTHRVWTAATDGLMLCWKGSPKKSTTTSNRYYSNHRKKRRRQQQPQPQQDVDTW